MAARAGKPTSPRPARRAPRAPRRRRRRSRRRSARRPDQEGRARDGRSEASGSNRRGGPGRGPPTASTRSTPTPRCTCCALSERTGLTRLPVNLMRLPPGKESFIPHAHSVEEEYVFVAQRPGHGDAGRRGDADRSGRLSGLPDRRRRAPPDQHPSQATTSSISPAASACRSRSPRCRPSARSPSSRTTRVTFYDEDTGQRVTMAEWFERANAGSNLRSYLTAARRLLP